MFRFKTKSYKIKGKKLTIPNNKSQPSKFTFIQREFFEISETFTIQYISCKLSQEQCSLPNNFLLRSRVFETTLHRILYLPKQPSTLKATKKLKHTTDFSTILYLGHIQKMMHTLTTKENIFPLHSIPQKRKQNRSFLH